MMMTQRVLENEGFLTSFKADDEENEDEQSQKDD
jgi:hypothetical protein